MHNRAIENYFFWQSTQNVIHLCFLSTPAFKQFLETERINYFKTSLSANTCFLSPLCLLLSADSLMSCFIGTGNNHHVGNHPSLLSPKLKLPRSAAFAFFFPQKRGSLLVAKVRSPTSAQPHPFPLSPSAQWTNYPFSFKFSFSIQPSP